MRMYAAENTIELQKKPLQKAKKVEKMRKMGIYQSKS